MKALIFTVLILLLAQIIQGQWDHMGEGARDPNANDGSAAAARFMKDIEKDTKSFSLVDGHGHARRGHGHRGSSRRGHGHRYGDGYGSGYGGRHGGYGGRRGDDYSDGYGRRDYS